MPAFRLWFPNREESSRGSSRQTLKVRLYADEDYEPARQARAKLEERRER